MGCASDVGMDFAGGVSGVRRPQESTNNRQGSCIQEWIVGLRGGCFWVPD